MNLDMDLAILDTETTGFPKDDWARVIEIGVILLRKGEVVDFYTSLVRPDILDYRADKALEINQISVSEIKSARSTSEVAADFLAWCKWHDSPTFTSYNVAFDRPMMERMGVQLNWGECLMERAMAVMGPAGKLKSRKGSWCWPSLTQAAEFFKIPPEGKEWQAHRALADACTATRIAIALDNHVKINN
jgi:DNA polymerase III epsilon subunit-like protein